MRNGPHAFSTQHLCYSFYLFIFFSFFVRCRATFGAVAASAPVLLQHMYAVCLPRGNEVVVVVVGWLFIIGPTLACCLQLHALCYIVCRYSVFPHAIIRHVGNGRTTLFICFFVRRRVSGVAC